MSRLSTPRGGQTAPLGAQPPVGDWLLLPTGQEPRAPRRGGDWSRVRDAGGLSLWTTAASEGWSGAPWRAVVFAGEEREIFLHGEIYPLGVDPDAAIRAAALGSTRAVGSLDGHFLWIERHGETWRVVTNRFGTLHAYAGPGAVGSSFDAVLAAASARRLDWPAVAGFFDHGFFPGDRTWYDDIQLLGPARGVLVRSLGDRVVAEPGERTWEWHHAPRGESFDDAVDGFAEAFGAVMRDLARDAPALPISGGLDSRATVAALPHGAPGWAFSYGWGETSIETRLARRIAAARDLEFEAFRVGSYLLETGGTGIDRVLDTGEGFQDLTLTRQLAVSKPLSQHAHAVVCAHWGDVWLDDLGLADRSTIEEAALVDHALGRARKRGGEWLLQHVVLPNWRLADESASPREALRRGVATELAATAHLEAPDARLRAWKTDGWSHRWTTGSLRAHQAAAFPRLPFYSTRLAEFCLGLDPRHVAGRRLQVEYLKRYAPDLARVPWQQTGLPLGAGRLRRTVDPVRRAVAKLRRRVQRQRVLQRNWEVQLLDGDRPERLRRWLLGSPNRPSTLDEVVDRVAVRDLLSAFFQEPTAARGYTVAMLLTLAARLERDT